MTTKQRQDTSMSDVETVYSPKSLDLPNHHIRNMTTKQRQDTPMSDVETVYLPESLDLPNHHIRNMTTKQGWEIPDSPIWAVAFRALCIIAVSRTNLNHWKDTRNGEWKKRTKVMVNRFHYSNLTAGLVLTTTAVLLSSHPPYTLLMSYDTPASYILVIVAFGLALLSVISGASVLIIYEISVTDKDMETLKLMSRRKVIWLLLWLAWPSVCLALATFCLLSSIFIACFLSENIIVKVTASLGLCAFLVNGLLAFDVAMFVGKPQASNTHVECPTSPSRSTSEC